MLVRLRLEFRIQLGGISPLETADGFWDEKVRAENQIFQTKKGKLIDRNDKFWDCQSNKLESEKVSSGKTIAKTNKYLKTISEVKR